MLNEAVTLASMIDQHHTLHRKGGTRCDTRSLRASRLRYAVKCCTFLYVVLNHTRAGCCRLSEYAANPTLLVSNDILLELADVSCQRGRVRKKQCVRCTSIPNFLRRYSFKARHYLVHDAMRFQCQRFCSFLLFTKHENGFFDPQGERATKRPSSMELRLYLVGACSSPVGLM